MSIIKDFYEALYKENCQDCGSRLYWEANFDADGTTYTSDCCKHIYTIRPHTVTIEREEEY